MTNFIRWRVIIMMTVISLINVFMVYANNDDYSNENGGWYVFFVLKANIIVFKVE